MALLSRLLAILVFALASPHDRPGMTAVSLRIPAASVVATSNVAWMGGRAWFAVAVDRELRLYRWQSLVWVLDGTVDLPEGMGGLPGAGGELRFTSVTGGVAPDFTSKWVGADTLWFALAARSHSRWRIVPFDDQFGQRHTYTFASGTGHQLIHGVFDACGCAQGPTTDQWYEYTDGIFVPTSPPGEPALCSTAALTTADSWLPIPDDPLVRDVDRAFHVMRFACADGWALATDGRKISVYEQQGRHLRRWLRVGVGPARLIGTEIDFALPRSVLNRLARTIGVHIPPAPRTTNVQPPSSRKPWQRAPITVRIKPGDAYAATDVYFGHPNVLTVTVSSRGGVHAMRFRWQNDRWVRAAAP